MRSSNVAWKVAALLSALCVSAAFAVARQWFVAAIAPALVVMVLAANRPALALRSTLFLAASTALAAVGTHLHLSVPLLVTGTAAALAAWDLAYLADRLSIAVSPEHRAVFQRSHLQSLAAAIAAGLMLAFLASVIRLQLPFGVVSLLALVLVLALAGIPRAISAKAEHS